MPNCGAYRRVRDAIPCSIFAQSRQDGLRIVNSPEVRKLDYRNARRTEHDDPGNDWSGGSRMRSIASGRRNSRPVCVLAPASAGPRILASVSEPSGTSRKPCPESLNPNMVKLFETPDQDADGVIGRVIPVSATRRNSIDQYPAAARTVLVDQRSDWPHGRSRTGSMRRTFRATCERRAGGGLIERSGRKRAGHNL